MSAITRKAVKGNVIDKYKRIESKFSYHGDGRTEYLMLEGWVEREVDPEV